MIFYELVQNRQSCRNFDPMRSVEREKIEKVLEIARLAPSACNTQPYQITVCQGELGKKVSAETRNAVLNRFTENVSSLLVISEQKYAPITKIASKKKENDFRSIDIGILCAHIVLAAEELGLSSCILGWFHEPNVRELCGLTEKVRLIVALGYASEGDPIRAKKRKSSEDLIRYL